MIILRFFLVSLVALGLAGCQERPFKTSQEVMVTYLKPTHEHEPNHSYGFTFDYARLRDAEYYNSGIGGTFLIEDKSGKYQPGAYFFLPWSHVEHVIVTIK